MEHLARTSPWVAFISVLGFVLSGLLVLIGLITMLIGGLTEELGLVGGILLGLVYQIIAFIYMLVALQLHRYAAAIRVFARSPDSLALEQALGYQRSFWRLVGIIAIVVTCIYAVVIACALLVALVAALMGG